MRTRMMLAACLALTACDDEAADGGDAGTGTVEVPAIEGEVARADFCALFAQIHCAANEGCCDVDARRSGSTEACLAAAPCPEGLDDMALAYDPQAAGDFLRAQAAAVRQCQSAGDDAEIEFLAGQRAAGEACSLVGSTPECGAGLECVAGEGADPAAEVDGVCAAKGPAGDACDEGGCESCPGGACAEAEDAYCEAEAAPPENTDWSDPDELCITANEGDSNAGTDADVTLVFLYDGRWYPCTIVGGIEQGEQKCCEPQRGSGTLRDNDASSGDMYIVMDDSDGLRFTSLKVTKGSDSKTRGTYNDGPNVSCKGCFLGDDCESCWVDSDGNGDCAVVSVPMSGDLINYCVNSLRNSDFL